MTSIRLLSLWVFCLIGGAVAALWMLIYIVSNGSRAWTLAISFDQLVNAAFGGDEDETISSRAGKAARRGRRWGCVLCRILDRLDANHCEKSIEQDRGKPLL